MPLTSWCMINYNHVVEHHWMHDQYVHNTFSHFYLLLLSKKNRALCYLHRYQSYVHIICYVCKYMSTSPGMRTYSFVFNIKWKHMLLASRNWSFGFCVGAPHHCWSTRALWYLFFIQTCVHSWCRSCILSAKDMLRSFSFRLTSFFLMYGIHTLASVITLWVSRGSF